MKTTVLVLLLLASCSDLEPLLPHPAGDAGDLPDAAADAAGPAPGDGGAPDEGSAALPPCLDLPGHELHEAGCREAMDCTGGQLGAVWFGPAGSGTRSLDFDDKVEGATSLRLECTGASWCGITDECPQGAAAGPKSVDLSGWATLHLALKGNVPDAEIKMASTPQDPADAQDEAFVRAADHGYTADDSWHELAIPLTSFTQDPGRSPHHPFDLAKVYKPLIVGLLGMTGQTNYTLRIDGVWLEP